MTTIADFLRASAPVAIKRAPELADGTVAGYASTFGGQPDSYGDVIAPGAFANSIAKHKSAGTAPLMLWSHDSDRPIGRWTEFAEDDHGLSVRGVFSTNTTGGLDAYTHVKNGDLNGLSIGYRIAPGGAKAAPHGGRLITQVDLQEVSIVAFPANRETRITGVKSFASRADLESILREHLPGRAVKKLLSGGWPAVSGDDDHQSDPAIAKLLSAVKSARLELKKATK